MAVRHRNRSACGSIFLRQYSISAQFLRQLQPQEVQTVFLVWEETRMSGMVRKAKMVSLMLLCVGVLCGCAARQKSEESMKGQEAQGVLTEEEQSGTAQSALAEERQEETGESAFAGASQESGGGAPEKEEYDPKDQIRKNQEKFYEEAGKQGISQQEARACLQVLMDDNIFRDGVMELTGLRIADIDGNGQTDMLVVVQDVQEKFLYGTGGLWFYMNEDEPYCFYEEECPYFGWYSSFWADLDDDGHVEITFCAQGTGCGGPGDHYKAVFKYRDHLIERMQLPSDHDDEASGEYRLDVYVFQEPEADSYSARCARLDEQVSFRAENTGGWDLPDAVRQAGCNVGGFYDLRVAEYEGKKVLQASEYLCGEGGVPHGVAEARFLITWDRDGTPQVLKWWVEAYGDTWANWRESRICCAGGYFYYVSQMDHYYLYRVREDGSEPQCLVQAHAGSVCVQDDEVFFINQTDGYGIYRVKTDGSGLTRLCNKGKRLQISAEYVYFCDTYHAEYDTRKLVTEEPSEFEDDFLYRMKKDGSDRVLIAADVRQFVLYDGRSHDVRYTGEIYCCRWEKDSTIVSRMDLDGQNESALCEIKCTGNILVYGGEIFGVGDRDDEGVKISQISLQNGEIRSFLVPDFIDCCIYNGNFYSLCAQETDDMQYMMIRRTNCDRGGGDIVHQYEFSREDSDAWAMSDLFATGNGIFFRQYVAAEEGCQWFRLTDDRRAERWEDPGQIPGTLTARNIEYGDLNSVMSVLESTEGYETYLADDLVYETDHAVGKNGEGRGTYKIGLPQFNSRISGYKKINQYFQRAYQEAQTDMEDFFQMLDAETGTFSYRQMTGYDYVYIGEKYITVAKYRGGYAGGIRAWTTQDPVTFDRETGEVVSLEELLGMTVQQVSARLTASAYKCLEGDKNGWFFLREKNKLAEEFDPGKFFLFPEGVGIYYERYAIDCGAAGDYLFVIPWEEVRR